jgi:hypothetical protein
MATNKCDEDGKGNVNSLYAIVIALRTGGVDNNDAKGRSYDDGLVTKIKKADHCCTTRDALLLLSSPSTTSSNYHVIGHDL